MTYDEALKYIHGVSNFFCKPGLERVSELCERLGNPQNKLKFIHVTGTNGKGSVCSMLSSILMTEGYKVGLYTSPYVREFNERMRINGENIPNDRLCELTESVKAVAEKMQDSPTEFELITAIAFQYFHEEACDVVVLEVGMGGRFDATNIIPAAQLSIITGVAIDHTAFLGNTVEQIASEKAGIIKYNCPVLFGGIDLDAERIIAGEASKMQAKLYKTDYSSLQIKDMTLNGTVFDYKERNGIHISLLGEYQPKNAAIVLDAVNILNTVGLSIKENSVIEGLAKASWQARFEIIKNDPLVIFDGAHNPQGVRAAVDSIKQYFGAKKVIIISGVLRDKDYRQIAASISEVASFVYTITPENPRALTAEEYAKIYAESGISSLPCPSIEDALKNALNQAKNTFAAVFCLGSLYTYSEIINII